VDEAGRGVGLEGGGQRLLRGQAGGQAMPFEAAMDATARQFGVEAAPHRLDPRRGVSYQTGSQRAGREVKTTRNKELNLRLYSTASHANPRSPVASDAPDMKMAADCIQESLSAQFLSVKDCSNDNHREDERPQSSSLGSEAYVVGGK
jgi:hypothetical protein